MSERSLSPIQRTIMSRLWSEPMSRASLQVVMRPWYSSHGITQSVNAMLLRGLLKEEAEAEGDPEQVLRLYARFDPEAMRPRRVYSDLSHYRDIISTWTTLARVRKARGDRAGWEQARKNAARARIARDVAKRHGPW